MTNYSQKNHLLAILSFEDIEPIILSKAAHYKGVARILGKGVLMYARAKRARKFDHTHLRNGKVEVQIITENAK